MDRENINDLCKEFINRMNYTILFNSTNKVNHINKIVYLCDNKDTITILKAILKIVFWNTPINVYLYFIKHFEKYNTKAFTTRALAVHLYNLLLEYDDSFIDYNYNNINIRNFENDVTNLKLDPYVVLIKKVFNESDSWFGIYKNNTPRVIANKFYDNDIVRKICNKYNGCLAGTVGLSYFGSIYRNKLDNVTLVIETNVLGNIINDTLNEYFSDKTNKAERESIVTDYIINEFKTNALYKALIKLDNTITIEQCDVNLFMVYGPNVRCSITITNQKIKYNLIFVSELNRKYDSNVNIYIQNIADIICCKQLRNSDRDYRDLIDFKLYNNNVIHNDKRCEELI